MSLIKPKFYIGTLSHKNLNLSNINEYRSIIKDILLKLLNMHKDKEVIIISSLANNSDRLVVEVANEVGLRHEVLLPMPLELYLDDFDENSFELFEPLFYTARTSKVIEFCDICTYDLVSNIKKYRDLQYKKMLHTMVDASQYMIYIDDSISYNNTEEIANILKYNKSIHKQDFSIIECKIKK